MPYSRRKFIKDSAAAAAATFIAGKGFSTKSYSRILGANDRVRVGVVGFSDRFRSSHVPPFMQFYKEMNFDMVAVSDLWKKRREEGVAFIKEKMGHDIVGCRNNDELYGLKNIDAVFISTADFQHALLAKDAVMNNCDVYCEKPFAETMDDNRAASKSNQSQRPNSSNWFAKKKRN